MIVETKYICKATSMRKFLFILAAATAFSCSGSRDVDNKAIEKIQAFYSSYIFGTQETTDSVIAKYCTKALAKKLQDDYNNEYSDGGGYAVWEFRSGAQDGEDIQKIEKIEPLGQGKYLVQYNDMGNIGSRTITIAIQGNEILFDKIE